MTGSIVTRTLKDGKTKRYLAVWRVNGKQKWKSFERRKDADKFLVNAVKATNEDTYRDIEPAPMETVFSEWARLWLDVCVQQGELKPSTAKSYKSMVKTHLKPAFGEYRSNLLSAKTIAEWNKTCADKIEAGTLAPKTFNNVLNLLHEVLTWARASAQSYLRHDPLENIKRLKKRKTEADFLEPGEVAALLKSAGSVENTAVLHVAVYAGLRRGEIFGLQWGDVQESDGKSGGILCVRRSVYQGAITSPKTKSSDRKVDVPQAVLDALARHRDLSGETTDGDYMFRTSEGTPMDPDNFYKRTFAQIRKTAKLRAFGLHALRHTYASLLIAQGENLKYISKQLGHASIQITADTYGHLFEETSKQAMRRLNRIIPVVDEKPKAKQARARRHLKAVAAA